MQAWLYCTDVGERHRGGQIAERLARRGLELRPGEPAGPGGAGVVLFRQLTGELCRLVGEWSAGGERRLLLVAVERGALSPGGPWPLLRAGADDVLVLSDLREPDAAIGERLSRWAAIDEALASDLVREHMVGASRAWLSALRQIVEAARFSDAPVLLLGETGTGKEQAAQLIHALDARPDKGELVVVDCTTIVPELAGSELFGHERGAFTSAVSARDGAFALADGGTLFLDEVGELTPALQAQLLRVTQERTYKRVGGNVWRRTDFRLVGATNRDLGVEEAEGRFRRDLYYRIAGWVCRLPPLRERREDIIPLARHFMARLRPDQEPPELDAPVRDYLLSRDYPGNVRDLRQLAARLLYRHVGPGPITAGAIPDAERPGEALGPPWQDGPFEQAIHQALGAGAGIREIRRAAEETAVRLAIADEGGNLQRAAQRLGVTDRALQLRRAARRQAGDEEVDAA
ncbi:MAG TPA: sigma 54-interacting transcriptional regulator [Chloroflexaceae bacterium]|nr:sigma 54-interacting transcriptional regulator [Chloroflexaceae bacterium]